MNTGHEYAAKAMEPTGNVHSGDRSSDVGLFVRVPLCFFEGKSHAH